MPYIDAKITLPVSAEKRESIKSKLGAAIAALGKTESWLMVGFEDRYDLYFAGKKQEKAAFVAVALYGKASDSACNSMTDKICSILEEELEIPQDHIYVTYRFVDHWGWNGENF